MRSRAATRAPLRYPDYRRRAATAPDAPQCFRGFVSCRPPLETAFRQALCRDPEPLAIIGEDSDRFAAAAAEDEQAAGKRIGIEFLAAELRQRVDALPSVDGFNRNQDAQLRRDLDQDADSSNSRLSAARSETDAFFSWIRSLPRRPSSSMVHSGSDCGRGATSSTNAAGAGFGDAFEAAAIRRFRWFHSTRSSVEVRLTPSFRATSTAAAHNSSGIRPFPLRLLLHASKRALASSSVMVAVLASPHRHPPRWIPGGRSNLTVIDGTIHASFARQTHGLSR